MKTLSPLKWLPFVEPVSNAFSWMKISVLYLRLRWGEFSGFSRLCTEKTTSHYPKRWQISSLMPCGYAFPRWNVIDYRVLKQGNSLLWHHNERDSVSNHQPYDCLLNRLLKAQIKETPRLRVTGLCDGNPPVTGEFPVQRVSNAENVSIQWRHHLENVFHCPGHFVRQEIQVTMNTDVGPNITIPSLRHSNRIIHSHLSFPNRLDQLHCLPLHVVND